MLLPFSPAWPAAGCERQLAGSLRGQFFCHSEPLTSWFPVGVCLANTEKSPRGATWLLADAFPLQRQIHRAFGHVGAALHPQCLVSPGGVISPSESHSHLGEHLSLSVSLPPPQP